MKKLTILVDMDGTTTDLVKKLLYRYNNDHGTDFNHGHITNWSLPKCLPNGHRVFKYMEEPGFFRDLPLIDGMQRVLSELHQDGHDLHILTTPFFPGTSVLDKMLWVEDHLPFIGAKKTMMVREKYMVKGDVLIDDKPSTIEKYRRAWPQSFIASISYPYNVGVAAYLNCHAPDHANFEQAWDTIGKSIKQLAHEEP